MAYPILKPNSSWFTPTVSTIKRATITTINIVDSYIPSEILTDSWDASVTQDGSIMCYVEGTVLTIAGNGSGKIMANEDCSYMFSGMTALTSVDCGVLDTSNTTNMEYMFGHTKAMKLTSINFGSNFNTSKVTNMLAMFRYCNVLPSIDVTGWDVSNVFSFTQVFEAMTNLKEIKGLDTWNTSSGICFGQMFSGCSKLEKLNLSSFDTRKAKADGTQTSGNGGKAACTHQIFYGMSNLREIILGENFTFAGDGTASDSYHGTLPTPSAIYIDGADGNWYTEDDAIYAPAVVPNLTYAVYYASPTVLDISIWERDSKKYIHLSAMRKYHNMHNEEIDIKLDILKESISEYEELTAEDIQSLFI